MKKNNKFKYLLIIVFVVLYLFCLSFFKKTVATSQTEAQDAYGYLVTLLKYNGSGNKTDVQQVGEATLLYHPDLLNEYTINYNFDQIPSSFSQLRDMDFEGSDKLYPVIFINSDEKVDDITEIDKEDLEEGLLKLVLNKDDYCMAIEDTSDNCTEKKWKNDYLKKIVPGLASNKALAVLDKDGEVEKSRRFYYYYLSNNTLSKDNYDGFFYITKKKYTYSGPDKNGVYVSREDKCTKQKEVIVKDVKNKAELRKTTAYKNAMAVTSTGYKTAIFNYYTSKAKVKTYTAPTVPSDWKVYKNVPDNNLNQQYLTNNPNYLKDLANTFAKDTMTYFHVNVNISDVKEHYYIQFVSVRRVEGAETGINGRVKLREFNFNNDGTLDNSRYRVEESKWDSDSWIKDDQYNCKNCPAVGSCESTWFCSGTPAPGYHCEGGSLTKTCWSEQSNYVCCNKWVTKANPNCKTGCETVFKLPEQDCGVKQAHVIWGQGVNVATSLVLDDENSGRAVNTCSEVTKCYDGAGNVIATTDPAQCKSEIQYFIGPNKSIALVGVDGDTTINSPYRYIHLNGNSCSSIDMGKKIFYVDISLCTSACTSLTNDTTHRSDPYLQCANNYCEAHKYLGAIGYYSRKDKKDCLINTCQYVYGESPTNSTKQCNPFKDPTNCSDLESVNSCANDKLYEKYRKESKSVDTTSTCNLNGLTGLQEAKEQEMYKLTSEIEQIEKDIETSKEEITKITSEIEKLKEEKETQEEAQKHPLVVLNQYTSRKENLCNSPQKKTVAYTTGDVCQKDDNRRFSCIGYTLQISEPNDKSIASLIIKFDGRRIGENVNSRNSLQMPIESLDPLSDDYFFPQSCKSYCSLGRNSTVYCNCEKIIGNVILNDTEFYRVQNSDRKTVAFKFIPYNGVNNINGTIEVRYKNGGTETISFNYNLKNDCDVSDTQAISTKVKTDYEINQKIDEYNTSIDGINSAIASLEKELLEKKQEKEDKEKSDNTTIVEPKIYMEEKKSVYSECDSDGVTDYDKDDSNDETFDHRDYQTISCKTTTSFKYDNTKNISLYPGEGLDYKVEEKEERECVVKFNLEQWMFDYVSIPNGDTEQKKRLYYLLYKYNGDDTNASKYYIDDFGGEDAFLYGVSIPDSEIKSEIFTKVNEVIDNKNVDSDKQQLVEMKSTSKGGEIKNIGTDQVKDLVSNQQTTTYLNVKQYKKETSKEIVYGFPKACVKTDGTGDTYYSDTCKEITNSYPQNKYYTSLSATPNSKFTSKDLNHKIITEVEKGTNYKNTEQCTYIIGNGGLSCYIDIDAGCSDAENEYIVTKDGSITASIKIIDKTDPYREVSTYNLYVNGEPADDEKVEIKNVENESSKKYKLEGKVRLNDGTLVRCPSKEITLKVVDTIDENICKQDCKKLFGALEREKIYQYCSTSFSTDANGYKSSNECVKQCSNPCPNPPSDLTKITEHCKTYENLKKEYKTEDERYAVTNGCINYCYNRMKDSDNYIYRSIDVTDPFPNSRVSPYFSDETNSKAKEREIGSNWVGYEDYIISDDFDETAVTGKNANKQVEYIIDISKKDIYDIRKNTEEEGTTVYTKLNEIKTLTGYKSNFIREFKYLFKSSHGSITATEDQSTLSVIEEKKNETEETEQNLKE